jgi:sporulation protein YlmC with PRC-barrel domain
MIRTQEANALRAKSILGARVRNYQGEDLGTVEDFVLDLKSGKISYIVLSFGGILGIGDKWFAVPVSSLSWYPEGEHFQMKADKAKLENAPGFDKDNWPMMHDRKWGSEIHRYYGEKPYWE